MITEPATPGARLKLLRKRLGKSQEEMAGALHLSVRGYQNYERGERDIPAATVDRAREHLGVNPRWLWDGVGERFLFDAATSQASGPLDSASFRQQLGVLIRDPRFHLWLVHALECALEQALKSQAESGHV